ncbi:MAG: dipeptidase [Candidatus Kariarchaeaceae archaeon]|jgi:membrane dipeptidase
MYIDTHVDTLWAMKKQNRTFSQTSNEGHIDLNRAREANLLAGFFTGFPSENTYATEKMLREWLEFANDPLNKIIRVTNFQELTQLQEERSLGGDDQYIGAILHLEGAAGIDTELHRLYIYYDCGLRSMSVTWNEENQFATGAGRSNEKNRGFTKEGLDLLSAMEDLGVMIDVSHLNDKSFWDLVNHTNSPIFASHSNLRKFAEHQRNLADNMVHAVADTNGSIGINFCRGFLSTNEDHPANQGCAREMIREVINLTDLKHVHIGSDFDGCTLPDDMKDITSTTSFFASLGEELSLSANELDRIKHENIKRIMRDVWK